MNGRRAEGRIGALDVPWRNAEVDFGGWVDRVSVMVTEIQSYVGERGDVFSFK